MELLTDPQAWIAFFTLTALELVLGIDNIIFISILVDRLPAARREFTRRLGLALAMFMRIGLLFTLAWMVGLTAPLFTVLGEEISGRDLILMVGGLFLIWKATGEIHGLVEGGHEDSKERKMAATFGGILAQIAVIDLVFSLDSIITAVGMVDDLRVMVAAVVAAVLLMMVAAGPIGRFVSRHPTVKTLALSFLIMIGMALVADSLDFHVPKGYIYFAMAFSVAVEMLNLRMRRNMGPTGAVAPRRRERAAE
jgi:predicted tellurium resistance membrane protein TerC